MYGGFSRQLAVSLHTSLVWKIPPPSVPVWALPILDANHVGFFPYRLILHGPCTRTTSCLPWGKPNRSSRYKITWPLKILVAGKSYLSPRWPIDHSQALQKKLRTDSQVPGRSSSPAAAVLVVLRWCSLAPQLETRKSSWTWTKSWLIHVDHLIIQMCNTSIDFYLSTLQ